MGGRGGSGRSSAAIVQVPVVDEKAMADLDIRDAYQHVLDSVGKGDKPSGMADAGPWVSMLAMRRALARLGWGREKQDREIMRFIRERKAHALSEPNRKMMTQEHIDAQLMQGGNTRDIFSLIGWRPRRD